ncbi:MAG: chaperonin GroEL [Waddliaceae bacterium]|nr:chaperonin GroEL [Waddliaceae bacterium]
MTQTPKEIIFEEDAREKLRSGIEQIAEVVSFTLGPKGRNVGMESWGSPTITNDGGSIVDSIELSDSFENMGASMAKEMVGKVKESCGDGTTTATLLLAAMVKSGVKHITSGISPIFLKRGMEKAVDAVLKAIDQAATPISDDKAIEHIATVSASGSAEVGKIIGAAYAKVGREGVITIENAKGTETSIELVEGMQFDRGYLSPYFCTNAEKMIVEMQNPKILLVNKKISTVHEILPALQSIAASGQELLIVAEDLEGTALSTLVVNKLQGGLKVCAVKAPGFGDNRKEMMEDIAVLTGATVVSDDTGVSAKEIDASFLGQLEKITVSKDNTTLVNGSGSEEMIQARIKQIDAEIDRSTSTYDKEKLNTRKAKLSGGVAVIQVGALSETEQKQRKQVFEDSLNSTRAAIESGTVAGGGVALMRARAAIDALELDSEEAMGAQVIYKACSIPAEQIARNTGKDGSVIVAEIANAKENFGFNALTEEMEDLVLAGIVDPAKVTKTALSIAASTAGIVLISEALIRDAEEEENEA